MIIEIEKNRYFISQLQNNFHIMRKSDHFISYLIKNAKKPSYNPMLHKYIIFLDKKFNDICNKVDLFSQIVMI